MVGNKKTKKNFTVYTQSSKNTNIITTSNMERAEKFLNEFQSTVEQYHVDYSKGLAKDPEIIPLPSELKKEYERLEMEVKHIDIQLELAKESMREADKEWGPRLSMNLNIEEMLKSDEMWKKAILVDISPEQKQEIIKGMIRIMDMENAPFIDKSANKEKEIGDLEKRKEAIFSNTTFRQVNDFNKRASGELGEFVKDFKKRRIGE